jgi:hypothetical protein
MISGLVPTTVTTVSFSVPLITQVPDVFQEG